MRRLLAAVLVMLALGGLQAAAGGTTGRAAGGGGWIVLGSDRDGTLRAYSVRPDGSRLSPILAGPMAFTPLALSRDGRTMVYSADFGLSVSRADGTRLRRVARDVYVSSEQLPALSPDGRLVAFARLSARGIWIVRADGRGLRRVALAGFEPDWAPDGRALALTESTSIVVQPLRGGRRVVAHGPDLMLARPEWSPDGRWIAYVEQTGKSRAKGLWVVRPDGRARHRVSRQAPSAFAWSPDGRSLAYGRDGGAAVVGVGGGRVRALRLGLTASAAAWSPDGRRLVLTGHRGDDPDQIWIVRWDGHGLRRVTSAGRNTVLGWTGLAPKLPRVRPAPPSERVAAAHAVVTRTPIGLLSADGTHVAFVPNASRTDCDHVVVWTPTARSLARLGARLPAPCANVGTLDYGIYDLALAGTRAAWADIEGCGNSCDVALKTATLAGPGAAFVTDAGGGGGAGGGDLWDFHLRGHGGLLVFNGGYRESQVLRIGSGRTTTLRQGDHSAFVESVSQNRIAIRETDGVTVLDEQGRVVRVFPFGRGELSAVRLDGDRLVVTRGDVLEAYDVATGAAELQRPLPSGYELTDADGGIAVLQRGNEILLLRLADGRSVQLAPGRGPVRADLEPTGLYFSYAAAGGGGRLVFMPRAEVVRRLGGSIRRTLALTGGYRILLTSNRDGRMRGYSIRPDGSRLTPLLPRSSALVPRALSRDGSTLAYGSSSGIYASRADGTRLRRVTRKPAQDAALSPDGRLLAFTKEAPGIWVVGTDGRGARRLTRREDGTPSWSPDGKTLAFVRSVGESAGILVARPLRGRARALARGNFLDGLEWSPDGRWIAYSAGSVADDLWVVRSDGTRPHRLARDIFGTFTWSPDGRRLAFRALAGEVEVVGLDGRGRRLALPNMDARDPLWLPDGRLALEGGDGQLWVVGVDGRGLRRVTSAGANALLGWTRLAPARPPAAPIPKTERVLDGRTLALLAPVSAFAADGARVAFVTRKTAADCYHVAVWTPANRTVARQRPAPCQHDPRLTGVALAGTTVAWADETCCGHTTDTSVVAAKLPKLDTPFHVAEATVSGDIGGSRVGDPVGDGTLLAFTFQVYCDGTAEPGEADACPPEYDGGVVSTQLWRVGGHGQCPGDPDVGPIARACTAVSEGEGKLDLLAVDAGRIVVGTKSGVEILNTAGRVLRDVPVTAKAAALSGDRLAVQAAAGVDVYDTASGRLVSQLPGLKGLQDLESGILVTASGSVVTLRRLTDGRTTTFQVTGKARAQLEAPGLFVAGARRITFTPMRELFR